MGLLQGVHSLHEYMLWLHTGSTLVVQQHSVTALYFFIAGHLYLRNPPTSIFLLHYFDDR